TTGNQALPRPGFGRHCVTAFAACSRCLSCRCAAADAGLRLLPWMAEMPVLQEQKPALHPNVRRGISLQSSLARVPAVTRFARPSGQPAAVTPAGRCLAEKPANAHGS